MLRMLVASVRLWSGRAEEAVGPAEDAVGCMVRADDTGGQVQAFATLGRILLAAGRIDEGLEATARAHTLSTEGDKPMGFTGLAASVLVRVALGQTEEALAYLEGLDVDALDVEAIGQSDALIGLSLVLLQDGKAERAVDLLERMGGAADPARHPASAAALALARSASAVEIDDLVDGVLGSRKATYHDRTQALLAMMLAAAAAGDADRAGALAHQATDLAGGTQDRLLQTVVAVMTDEALGPDAPPGNRLHGVAAEGWRGLARLALGAGQLGSLT
jgi:hypothetical protein